MFKALYSWENLYLAYRMAAKGKRGRATAASFEYRLEDNLIQLQEELRDGQYQPGRYHSFYIHEPKRRLISAAPAAGDRGNPLSRLCGVSRAAQTKGAQGGAFPPHIGQASARLCPWRHSARCGQRQRARLVEPCPLRQHPRTRRPYLGADPCSSRAN